MKKTKSTLSAFLIVLCLSGCASNPMPGGRTSYSDPSFCEGTEGSALCLIGVGAVVGAAVVVLGN